MNMSAVPGLSRIATALLLFVIPSVSLAQQPREPVTVMSFNIRYGTAKDGEDEWSRRKAMLFDLVREQDADIVGLQEALDFQIDEITTAVPVYATIGVGRDDGRARGEFAAILFRKSRFRVAEAGTFWLSDTPTVPGSKHWGNKITRICTWARLVDRDGRAFYAYNVHLDHQSQPSRERSTQLLRERVDARPVGTDPVIVTGDFNVAENNPALATLRGPLVDTFRILHAEEQTVGTFTGFKFGNTTGEKIDYILVEPATEVMQADIVRFSKDHRYPSDHFPVVARVRFVDR